MSKVTPNRLSARRTMANNWQVQWVLLIVLLQTAVLSVHASDSGPLVTLKQGRYRGNFVTSPKGDYVAEYLGIPFAKPPVNKLRLANPEQLDPKPDEIFDAKGYAPSCPQVLDTTFGNFSGATMWNPPGGIIAEDCLYLNVWVSQARSRHDMTVMVWIYGGGFFSGSTALDMYNGKTLAAFGDVIIVSISYRLGALGFLSTADERIQGNFGMMDQIMALKWVRDNIREFGGNPEQVTIFGESAGAVSVTYHLLSPFSNGLFQRAIIQSTAADELIFADIDKARRFSKKFSKRMECPDDDNLLDCLRQKHYGLFLRQQWFSDSGERHDMRCPFKPTISGFMPRPPKELLDDLVFNKRDILLGVVKNEATYFMVYRLRSVSKNDPVSGQTQKDIKNAIKQFSPDLNAEQQKEVFDFYTKNIDEYDLVGNRKAIDRLYGERYFVCPTKSIAERNTEQGGNSYFYFYNHRASNEVWPAWMGVMHSAEIQFVFGQPLNASRGFTRDERRFSERLMTYWVNFAKSGNPNNQGNTPWPKYTSDKKEYVELDVRESRHEGGYKESECRFWADLVSSGSASYRQLVMPSVVTLVSLALLL